MGLVAQCFSFGSLLGYAYLSPPRKIVAHLCITSAIGTKACPGITMRSGIEPRIGANYFMTRSAQPSIRLVRVPASWNQEYFVCSSTIVPVGYVSPGRAIITKHTAHRWRRFPHLSNGRLR